jgi:hypothetical protein
MAVLLFRRKIQLLIEYICHQASVLAIRGICKEDDDPIAYHDVEVGKGSPEELADAIEGVVTSAEQAGMSRDSVQSLRQLVNSVQVCFQAQAGRRLPCECEAPSHKSARRCRTRANLSSQVRSAAAEDYS